VGRIIFRNVAGIHFTVEEEKKQAPSWLVGGKGFVVPNAVEFQRRGDGERFQSKMGVDEKVLLLGIVGRIHKKKGFDVIIPVIEKCKRKDLVLVVVGPDENEYRKRVEKMIQDAGLKKRVIFTGMLKDGKLADAYAGVDLLVMPSYEENFGNVVAEAAAQGTPCIVSDQVGLKEWVFRNDIGLVLPMDSDVWADTLSDIRKEDISTRWEPGRISRITRESFSMENVARKLLDHYEFIIRCERRRGCMHDHHRGAKT
jgi:glycosyltransferase involved in cell wall biosynthesis